MRRIADVVVVVLVVVGLVVVVMVVVVVVVCPQFTAVWQAPAFVTRMCTSICVCLLHL
jgi:hypothetical protein